MTMRMTAASVALPSRRPCSSPRRTRAWANIMNALETTVPMTMPGMPSGL